TVTLGGGDDVLTLREAPGPEVLVTTLNTGEGSDTVVAHDLSPQLPDDLITPTTIVNLGGGDDQAQLRSPTANTSLEVNGGPGADEIIIQITGAGARTVVNAGTDGDTVRVLGMNLDPS